MSDIAHVRASIEATRGQLKAAQRVIRTSLQFINDLDRQLAELEIPAQPGGIAINGSNGHSTPRPKLVGSIHT